MARSKKFDDTFAYHDRVPSHTRDSIYTYLVNGWEPGGFLTAVLLNDLYAATSRADSENVKNLASIAKYVYQTLPPICYGTKENIAAWCKMDDDARRDILVQARLVESVFEILSTVAYAKPEPNF